MQAKRLAQVGLGAFTWDFWTWFTSGNCATVLQAMPNFTSTWSAFPNLGYKCVSCPVLWRPQEPQMASGGDCSRFIMTSHPRRFRAALRAELCLPSPACLLTPRHLTNFFCFCFSLPIGNLFSQASSAASAQGLQRGLVL